MAHKCQQHSGDQALVSTTPAPGSTLEVNTTLETNEQFDSTNTSPANKRGVESAELADLQVELKGVIAWFDLGVQLKIPTHDLLAIREDHRTVEKCRLNMLIKWEQLGRPTWTKLFSALVNIGMKGLADSLAEKYGLPQPFRVTVTPAKGSASSKLMESEQKLTVKMKELKQAKQLQTVTSRKLEKEVSAEVPLLQHKVKSLTTETEFLKMQLKRRTEEMEMFEKMKLSAKEDELQLLDSLLKEKNEQISSLQKELTQKETEFDATKKQLKDKETELAGMMKELSAKSNNISPNEQAYLDAVLKAMRERGTLEHTLVHGLFAGPAGSGKSSLMSRLMGEIPSLNSPSTGVAKSVVQVKVKKLSSIAVSVKYNSPSSWLKLLYNEEAFALINFASCTVSSHSRQNVSVDTTHFQADDKLASDHELLEVSPNSKPIGSTSESLHSTGTVTVPPKGYVRPIDLFRNSLDHEHLEKLRQQFKDSWSLYLTDTGGQIEFQEVLPLLVSGSSIFFITFRLDRNLNERYMIEYRLSDGNRSKPYKSTLTVEQMILQTLASVASVNVATDSCTELKKSDQLKPKVFIVGTHKDQLDEATRESIIDEIDRCLQDVIKPTAHYDADLVQFAREDRLIYAVNNFSDDDSDFQEIRSGVENVVERDEYKMTFPSHWLIFGLVIRQQTITDRIITYEECFAIAKDCGINDRTEFNNALQFLYKTVGLVRHFDTPCLCDMVIRDPQVIFDHVTQLIVQTFSFSRVGKQRSEEFKQKGIFCFEDLSKSMQSYKHMSAEKLVELLKQLLIVAPFKEDRKTKYFLPSILAHSETCELHSVSLTTSQVPPLLIIFKCGYCPKGLAGALIVYLLTHEPRSKFSWILQTKQIFRDQVSFLVSSWDIITLCIHPTYLMLIHSREVSTSPQPSVVEPIEAVCNCTREFIEKGILNVISSMKLTPDAGHSLTFHCQDDKCTKRNGVHPASEILPRNTKCDPCSLCCSRFGNETIISSLPHGCLTWFGTGQCLNTPSMDCETDATHCQTNPDSEKPLYTESKKKLVIELHKPKPAKLDTKPLSENVKLILLTSNENEKWAVYEKLEPPNLTDSFPQLDRALYIPQTNTVIGTFAGYTVAVLTTDQGKKCELELKKALDTFPNAQSIIGVGIGYGKNMETIKLGDVMVSDHIENASQVAIVESHNEMKVDQCGGRLPIKRKLLRYFNNKTSEWHHENEFRVSEDGRKSQAKVGTIVSCETLIKSTLRDQYMDLMAQTIGGEMEGASLINMTEWMEDDCRPLSVIVIKGVADYADNQDNEHWQYTAAKAAVDFVHYCLKETNGLGEF